MKKNFFNETKSLFEISYIEYKNEYNHTFVSYWWHTLNFGLFISGISLVFGALFSNSQPNLISYLTINFLLWNFFNANLLELSDFIRTKRGLILNQNLKPMKVFLIGYIKNIFKLLSSIPILIIVCILESSFKISDILVLLYFLFIFFIFNFYASFLASLFTTIFQEFKLLINLVLRILFFVTPIFWFVETRSGTLRKLVELNPLFHFIEGVRSHLLDLNHVTEPSLIFPGLLTLIIFIITNYLYKNFNKNLVLYV